MKKVSGFTLIELIIGITILSLLAVALLAALDPVEQFNKARDTASRNSAMEIHNALLRYNAANESYPGMLGSAAPVMVTGSSAFIDLLITPGELKANFANAAGGDTSLNKIGLYKLTDGIATCYRPQSKQFSQGKGLARIEGAPGAVLPTIADATECPGGAANNAECAWCAQ